MLCICLSVCPSTPPISLCLYLLISVIINLCKYACKYLFFCMYFMMFEYVCGCTCTCVFVLHIKIYIDIWSCFPENCKIMKHTQWWIFWLRIMSVGRPCSGLWQGQIPLLQSWCVYLTMFLKYSGNCFCHCCEFSIL